MEAVCCRRASKKFGTPYLFWQSLNYSQLQITTTSSLVYNLGLGVAYQCLGRKFVGVLARGASKKNWYSYLFLQPLKPTTSNLGLAYQKQRLGPKLAGAWAREASEKIRDPLFISATDRKFGTQQVYLAKHKF